MSRANSCAWVSSCRASASWVASSSSGLCWPVRAILTCNVWRRRGSDQGNTQSERSFCRQRSINIRRYLEMALPEPRRRGRSFSHCRAAQRATVFNAPTRLCAWTLSCLVLDASSSDLTRQVLCLTGYDGAPVRACPCHMPGSARPRECRADGSEHESSAASVRAGG
jgi:hypothetical protein